jgi:hypothetical protein
VRGFKACKSRCEFHGDATAPVGWNYRRSGRVILRDRQSRGGRCCRGWIQERGMFEGDPAGVV